MEDQKNKNNKHKDELKLNQISCGDLIIASQQGFSIKSGAYGIKKLLKIPMIQKYLNLYSIKSSIVPSYID